MKLFKSVQASRWFHPLLLLLWVAVGVGLRLLRLNSKVPWTDEFATIVFSLGHTFKTIPLDQALSINALLQPIQPDLTTRVGDVLHHLLKESNHPPLYFVLAHLWMRLFPTEDGLISMWAARSLPALFGVLSIPAMFGFGYLAFRSRLVGQMAAALMAVSPFAVYLAQEARHYTLAILFAIASISCLIVAVRSIHHRTLLPLWVGLIWVVVNTLGVATHYFFALTLGAEALALLALAWRQNKSRKVQEEKRGGNSRLISETQQQTSSHPVLSLPLLSDTKTHLQPHSKPWQRIYFVAAGTVTGSLVWVPILHSNYNYGLTHWIYDGEPLKRWLEPIGRVLAWFMTMLISLPMEVTTLPLGILITSGLVTVLFILWTLPIFQYGLKLKHFSADVHLSIRVLRDFLIGVLVLFFGITYGLDADLTLAPRYQFVYFPVAIALMGAALATAWNTPIQGDSMLSQSSKSQPFLKFWLHKGDKKAVIVIGLVAVLGSVVVTYNLGYLQSIRPDLLVNVIEEVSDAPVLIVTTHQHHGHTGRMMGIAWEFNRLHRAGLPYNPNTDSPQFLLARETTNSHSKNPTITLQETVAKLPRPLDVWLVNFHAGVHLTEQQCFTSPRRLPEIDSYWYRLYYCPELNQGKTNLQQF